MSPSASHRSLVHRRGVPAYSTDDLEQVLTYLWGRQLRFQYGVPGVSAVKFTFSKTG